MYRSTHHTFVYQYTCIVYFRHHGHLWMWEAAASGRGPIPGSLAAGPHGCCSLPSSSLKKSFPTEFLFFQKNFKLVSSRPAGLIADQRIFLQQQSEWILFYCWYSLFCRIIGSLKIVYLLGRIQSINRNFGAEAGLPTLLQFWIFLQIIWVPAAADDFFKISLVSLRPTTVGLFVTCVLMVLVVIKAWD